VLLLLAAHPVLLVAAHPIAHPVRIAILPVLLLSVLLSRGTILLVVLVASHVRASRGGSVCGLLSVLLLLVVVLGRLLISTLLSESSLVLRRIGIVLLAC